MTPENEAGLLRARRSTMERWLSDCSSDDILLIDQYEAEISRLTIQAEVADSISKMTGVSVALKAGASAIARELADATRRPVASMMTDDGAIMLLVDVGHRELTVTLAEMEHEDGPSDRQIYFDVEDQESGEGHAGIIAGPGGLDDLARWVLGAELERKHLKIGVAAMAQL